MNAQNDRYAWLDTAGSPQSHKPGARSAGAHHDSAPPASATRPPAWFLVTADEFGRQDITRVDLAATGSSSPVPPGIPLLLSVIALALLAPVLIFIGTATRLSAARREQRFAALRLVGATRRQISALSAVESAVAAAAGVHQRPRVGPYWVSGAPRSASRFLSQIMMMRSPK